MTGGPGSATGRPSMAAMPAREHLALALDTDDLDGAVALARRLRSWFAVAKVGLELFGSAGPDAIAAMADEGFIVFADIKLHDIPTTVGRAARALGRAGAGYLTVHASGGAAMIEAAVHGLAEGSLAGSGAVPDAMVLGVTVLTSDPSATPARLSELVGVAEASGCGGVVCAGSDLPVVLRRAPRLRRVVPGIRPADTGADDQARVATPGAAIAAGADLLVIGRAVTAAADPAVAAAAVHAEVTDALATGSTISEHDSA